jgi:uncharacterized PurR-regulated membrane protein YhhQ (DUF165 family)
MRHGPVGPTLPPGPVVEKLFGNPRRRARAQAASAAWPVSQLDVLVIALLVFAYAATVPLANWMVAHVGTVCVPQGPCLIPIAPGLLAPSGVLVIGAALVLRDLVQRRAGIRVSLACIGVGAALSALLAPPALVVASAAAFTFSEMADFAVYTPIARTRFAAAILASVTAGAAVDSALFLWLAFGSLNHLEGQIIGKIYAALVFLAWRWATGPALLARPAAVNPIPPRDC